MKTETEILVVGAGAAGMMAAIAAAEEGAQVLLLERNDRAGRKIFITGKGRCNVTNACDTEELFSYIISNEKFMYSALYQFHNHQIMEFFESKGCPLKVERGNRVFPVSDHSSDVIKVLTQYMDKLKVKVRYHALVEDILIGEEGKIKGVLLDSGEQIFSKKVILGTGGLSYAPTGSDGKMLKILEHHGHQLVEPKPALVPFELKENLGEKLQGLSLKNVSLTVKNGKKILFQGFGEMLFTHFGISGPLVLSASSYYAKKAYGKEVSAVLDLKPALDLEQLDKRILRDFEENQNKQFKNALDKLLPAKLIPVIIEYSGIMPEKKVNEITREERKRLVFLLKNFEMTITGTRSFREAIVTQGGVRVKEVNPSTMESKIIPGLYLAGEMLDIDAVTGGYNITLAWSTGHLAGSNAAWSCKAEKGTV